jgi:hypothetical protein
MNTYAYARGGPTMRRDRFGLVPNPAEAACFVGPNPLCLGGLLTDVLTTGAAILATGAATAEIIDLDTKRKEKAEAKERERLKNCPPEDDGWCEHEQKQLLARQLTLLTLHTSDLMPLWQYRQAVQNLNWDIEAHNRMCPDYPVEPIPLPGPTSID